MRLRWTEAAADDVEHIADYLTEHSPQAANRLTHAIRNIAATLLELPNRGRPGRIHGTRELVVPSLPYVIVYLVADEAVHIARVLHTAQRWP